MTEEHPTRPDLDMNEDDLAALRQRYNGKGVIELFRALGLPVCDDTTGITQVITSQQKQREQDSFGAQASQRQEAVAWLTAARFLGNQASRRELLLQVQEEVNRMLGFRLERPGQAGKPYTSETRADLKAAAVRGFNLNDDLAERFLRAFEHGCELRLGQKVPISLRVFNAREVAVETFEATLTTLLPPIPPADTPAAAGVSVTQLTEPMPTIRPKRAVTKVNVPPPAPPRQASGPLLMPDKALSKLVLNQGGQDGGQDGLPAEWLLTRDTFSIGRMPESDLCLKDDKRVSREHAVIHRAPTAYILTDLNSSNGTFLNGAPLTEPAVLHPGDQIRFGHTELTFVMEPLSNHHDE